MIMEHFLIKVNEKTPALYFNINILQYYDPNFLIDQYYCTYNTEQFKRILFISGLEYKQLYITPLKESYLNIYIYTLKEFFKYLKACKLLYPEYVYTYNKQEIIEFFK